MSIMMDTYTHLHFCFLQLVGLKGQQHQKQSEEDVKVKDVLFFELDFMLFPLFFFFAVALFLICAYMGELELSAKLGLLITVLLVIR